MPNKNNVCKWLDFELSPDLHKTLNELAADHYGRPFGQPKAKRKRKYLVVKNRVKPRGQHTCKRCGGVGHYIKTCAVTVPTTAAVP